MVGACWGVLSAGATGGPPAGGCCDAPAVGNRGPLGRVPCANAGGPLATGPGAGWGGAGKPVVKGLERKLPGRALGGGTIV